MIGISDSVVKCTRKLLLNQFIYMRINRITSREFIYRKKNFQMKTKPFRINLNIDANLIDPRNEPPQGCSVYDCPVINDF